MNEVLCNKYKIKKKECFLFLTTMWIYFLLATGAIFPEGEWSTKTIVSIANIIMLLCYINYGLFNRSLIKSFSIFFPLLISFLVSLFRSNEIFFAIEKIEGGILVGVIVAAGVSFVIRLSNEEKFLKVFLAVSFLILTLTLLYRFSLGITDRNARFLLNGPIVFGWLMGLNFVICIYLFFTEKKILYLLLAIVFILSVAWTQSKGPILASFAGLSVIFFKNVDLKKIRLILFMFLSLFFVYYIFSYFDFGERYLALIRIFNNDLNESDGGSVNIRAEMFLYSIRLWESNFLFGVGIGNWKEYVNNLLSVNIKFIYPHNFLAESLSETGVFGFTFLGGLYFIVFYKSSFIPRLIMLYFTICLLFSGDASYLRFLFSIPIGFLIAKVFSKLSLQKRA